MNFKDFVEPRRGLEEIKPLLEVVGQDGYVAGSYAAWMGAQHAFWEPGDIDVFCVSQEAHKRVLERCDEWSGCFHKASSQISTTYTLSADLDKDVQIVMPHPTWETFPDDILGSFDMDICAGVLLHDGSVLVDQRAGYDEANILRVNDPLRSALRMLKYHKRGVVFHPWQVIKLFKAWEAMPSDMRRDIEERLRADFLESQQEPEPDYDIGYDDFWWGE